MYAFKNGQGSIILRVPFKNSANNAGLTGLTSASAGLIISTVADVEASATAYTQAGTTIESITTLGTYAAPTATKCRFKEVDSTNHPGLYEIQIADARFAVSNAKSLIVSWSGAAGLLQDNIHIPLQNIDPYDVLSIWTKVMVESYSADGSAPTPAQSLFLIQQALTEWVVSGSTVTIKKLDGTTTAITLTLNSSTVPTSMTRSA